MSRDPRLALGLSALALLQAAAFWMICADQVHKAEVRHAAVQADKVLLECARPSQTGRVAAPCGEPIRVAGPTASEIGSAMR
jgi:hypothetical protein